MLETLQPAVAETADAAFDRRKQLVLRAVELHYTYLLAFVRRFVSHHDAEDVLQELLKYCLLHMREDRIDSLPTLRRKAYFLVLDHHRKRQRLGLTQSVEETEPQNEPVAPEHREQAFSPESEELLQQKFWSEYPVELTDRQRRVLWLHGRHGLTVQEISEREGIPSSTAHDWIKIGRERLLDVMENEKHN